MKNAMTLRLLGVTVDPQEYDRREEIAIQLRLARISGQEVAARAGLSAPQVSRWLNGKAVLSPQIEDAVLQLLAEARARTDSAASMGSPAEEAGPLANAAERGHRG